ncbi:MAG: hypothetical protein HFI83_04550 [Eubacterium sp.]|nr:hypothetical protein [Eubacterium sp.]
MGCKSNCPAGRTVLSAAQPGTCRDKFSMRLFVAEKKRFVAFCCCDPGYMTKYLLEGNESFD